MATSELFNACLNKAMNLCSRKETTVSEIEERLISWGASAVDAGKIIEILTKEKFVDERRYAEAFARDKLRYNKWGRIKIAVHLKQKKINSQLVKDALDKLDETEYREILSKLLDNHRKSVKSRSKQEFRAKMFRFALSRGFESSLISEIIKIDEEY